MPGETPVSFEDLFGTPEGANGVDDLSFSFTNTRTDVAEPLTLALAGVGFGAAFGRRATRRRT